MLNNKTDNETADARIIQALIEHTISERYTIVTEGNDIKEYI